ncbi:MAG: hypothetical protein B0D92_03100 [Spirochaeta sp. LUC14_002_19_P3]|nr:MAG: hypothetical protein B0D92_03100 [Spirochaeta sp. LUC14_002_19_P3]
MQAGSAYFYVTLKDSFTRQCREEKHSLFDSHPYSEARQHFSPGKVYPVLKIAENGHRLTLIDNNGLLCDASIGLFKFAENKKNSEIHA